MFGPLQRPQFIVLGDGVTAIPAHRIQGLRLTGPWPSPALGRLEDDSEVEVNWADAVLLAGAFTPATRETRVVCVDARGMADGYPPELKEALLLGMVLLGGTPVAVTAGGVMIPPGYCAVRIAGSDGLLGIPSGESFENDAAFLAWSRGRLVADAGEPPVSVDGLRKPLLH
jgi:hypothetical protein